MAGGGGITVLDTAKYGYEKAEAAKARNEMMQGALGQLEKTELLGYNLWQKQRDDQRKEELTGLTTAGALVGGIHNLPTETKDRIPGILGMEMPRDEQGHVVITPSISDMVSKAGIDAIKEDPSLAQIALGWREKEADPAKLAANLKIQDMKSATIKYSADEKYRGVVESNAARIQAQLIAGRSREEAALIGAKGRIGAAGIKEAALDKPSMFLMDEKGNMQTLPQWQITHPNQAPPPMLSYRQADELLKSKTADAKVKQTQSATDLNNKRIDALTAKLSAEGKDPTSDEYKRIAALTKMWQGSQDPALSESARNEFAALFHSEMKNTLTRYGFSPEDITALDNMGGGTSTGTTRDWSFNGLGNILSAIGYTALGVADPTSKPTGGHQSPGGPNYQQHPGTGDLLTDPDAIDTYLGQ